MSSVMAPLVVEKYPRAQKAPAPVALLDLGEFALDFVRRSALHEAHQVADRQLWRDRYEHVDVVARQHAFDDLDRVLCANLAANITDPQAQSALQHLEAVFRRPDDVIAVIVNAMLAGRVLHDLTRASD